MHLLQNLNSVLRYKLLLQFPFSLHCTNINAVEVHTAITLSMNADGITHFWCTKKTLTQILVTNRFPNILYCVMVQLLISARYQVSTELIFLIPIRIMVKQLMYGRAVCHDL